MAGGYHLLFPELGEEMGMLPLAFLSQKLDEQNIHFSAPQRPTNFSTPAPSSFPGPAFHSQVGKGMRMQRDFNIHGSNSMDASEHLNRVDSKTETQRISNQDIQVRNGHLQQRGKLIVEFQKPLVVTESSFQQLIQQYHKFS